MMSFLSSEAEERAQRLHRGALIMICHDHNLFPEDLDAMVSGGVTAKLVHVCADSLAWSEHEVYLTSKAHGRFLQAGPDRHGLSLLAGRVETRPGDHCPRAGGHPGRQVPGGSSPVAGGRGGTAGGRAAGGPAHALPGGAAPPTDILILTFSVVWVKSAIRNPFS